MITLLVLCGLFVCAALAFAAIFVIVWLVISLIIGLIKLIF